MMESIITENGVTYKELEKIFIHGFVRLAGSLPVSFWNGMTRC